MDESFDPYHVWLGIPRKDQPAHHYRLLGVETLESDLDIIERAADRQISYLHSIQNRENAALAQRLLSELSAAQSCLLDVAKKREYDAKLLADSQRRGLEPAPAQKLAAPPLPSRTVDANADDTPHEHVAESRIGRVALLILAVVSGMAVVLLALGLTVFLTSSPKPDESVAAANAEKAEPPLVDLPEPDEIRQKAATEPMAVDNAGPVAAEPEPRPQTALDDLDPKDATKRLLLAAAWGDAERLPPGHVRLYGDGRWMHWHKIHYSSLAFSPDGQTLASCSWDGTVRLTHIRSGNLVRVFESGVDGVGAIVWHPRHPERIFATSGTKVFAIDIDSGEWRQLYEHGDSLGVDLAASVDGKLLISAAGGKAVWYSLEQDKRLREVAHRGLRGVDISRDGTRVATAGGNSVVSVWDRRTGEQLHSYKGKRGEFYNNVTFHPSDGSLAVGLCNYVGAPGLTRLWKPGEKTWSRVLRSRHGYVWSLQYSPDGRWFADGCNSACAHLWDTSVWKHRRLVTANTPAPTEPGKRTVRFSPDSKTLASAGSDNAVHLWDVDTGRSVAEPVFGRMHAVALHPRAEFVAAAGDKGRLGIWNLSSDEGRRVDAHDRPIRCLAFSPDGDLLATGGDDGAVRFWNAAGEAAETELKLEEDAQPGSVTALAFHPHAPIFAWTTSRGRVHAVDRDSNASLFQVQEKVVAEGESKPHPSAAPQTLAIAFSGDGELFATGAAIRVKGRHVGGMVNIRRTSDGEPVASVHFTEAVHAVAFHPTNETVAVVSIQSIGSDRTLARGNARRLLTLMDRTGKRLLEREMPVHSVSFSHDGSRLLLACSDGKLRTLDLQTEELQEFKVGPRRGVIAQARFGPYDRHAVTANHNGTVSILRIEEASAPAP